MTSVAACACSALTPGPSRATISNAFRPRSSNMRLDCEGSIGTQNSLRNPGARAPRNPRGITPMTSNERPATKIVRPTIEGSLPKRVRQVRSASTMTSARASEGK